MQAFAGNACQFLGTCVSWSQGLGEQPLHLCVEHLVGDRPVCLEVDSLRSEPIGSNGAHCWRLVIPALMCVALCGEAAHHFPCASAIDCHARQAAVRVKYPNNFHNGVVWMLAR